MDSEKILDLVVGHDDGGESIDSEFVQHECQLLEFPQDLDNTANQKPLSLPGLTIGKSFEARWRSLHDSTLSQRNDDSTHQFQYLCDRCELVDLQASDFLPGCPRRRDVHGIGPYWDVVQRNCALCRLVVRVISINQKARERVQEHPNHECILGFKYVNHWEYPESTQNMEYSSLVFPRALAVSISDMPVYLRPNQGLLPISHP